MNKQNNIYKIITVTVRSQLHHIVNPCITHSLAYNSSAHSSRTSLDVKEKNVAKSRTWRSISEMYQWIKSRARIPHICMHTHINTYIQTYTCTYLHNTHNLVPNPEVKWRFLKEGAISRVVQPSERNWRSVSFRKRSGPRGISASGFQPYKNKNREEKKEQRWRIGEVRATTNDTNSKLMCENRNRNGRFSDGTANLFILTDRNCRFRLVGRLDWK